MPELLFFVDSDGTVIDSNSPPTRPFQNSLADAVEIALHGIFPNIPEQIRDNPEVFLSLFDINMHKGLYSLGLSWDNIIKVKRNLGKLLQARQDEIQPYPGMTDAINLLASAYPLYFLTSNDSGAVESQLKQNGINGYKNILGSDKKGDKVRKILNIRAQERYKGHVAYMVGDTAGDMLEGRDGNTRTIHVPWGWHSRERLGRLAESNPRYNPDHSPNSPLELQALFGLDAKGVQYSVPVQPNYR